MSFKHIESLFPRTREHLVLFFCSFPCTTSRQRCGTEVRWAQKISKEFSSHAWSAPIFKILQGGVLLTVGVNVSSEMPQ